MSKLSNTLLLLSYLQNGRKYSIQELSEKIEVTPRMIRIYKEELEKAGFIIETIYGPYGGYVLKKNNIAISFTFNEYDLEAIKKLKKELPDSEYLVGLLDKIKMVSETKKEPMQKQETEIYNVLSRAIKEKRKVEIKYDSLEKGIHKRIIQPLELFYLKDSFGVAAFCEMKKDLRHFDLKRIKTIKLLEENY